MSKIMLTTRCKWRKVSLVNNCIYNCNPKNKLCHWISSIIVLDLVLTRSSRNKSAVTTIFSCKPSHWFISNRKLKAFLMLPKTQRVGLVIQARHSRHSSIQMTSSNALLKNKIASEKKTPAALTYCLKYIINPTQTSHFFQKENQQKLADSPVFLTRPKEKKKKREKKSKKRRIIRRKKCLNDEF